MGLASYFFTKNIDRTWRLLENLEAGMIGMNTGKTHWKLFLYLSNFMQAIHLLLNRPLEESKRQAMERSRAKTLLSTNILSRKQERWLWMAISDWTIPWDHFFDHTHVSKLLNNMLPVLPHLLGFQTISDEENWHVTDISVFSIALSIPNLDPAKFYL